MTLKSIITKKKKLSKDYLRFLTIRRKNRKQMKQQTDFTAAAKTGPIHLTVSPAVLYPEICASWLYVGESVSLAANWPERFICCPCMETPSLYMHTIVTTEDRVVSFYGRTLQLTYKTHHYENKYPCIIGHAYCTNCDRAYWTCDNMSNLALLREIRIRENEAVAKVMGTMEKLPL